MKEKKGLRRTGYSLWIILLLFNFEAAAKETYPAWKIKLSYALLAKGKELSFHNPKLAREYFQRAYQIYPRNQEAKKLALNVRASEREKPKKLRSPSYLQPQVSSGVREDLPPPKGINLIVAQYQGISEQETYPSWKRGPTINTVLDIYHPEHPGKELPYYKDFEGFKINEAFGVWANYEIEKAPVGMETLILDAKEFARYSDEELREYVSSNEKEFWDWELRYFYKDYWPKFTWKIHTSDTRRVYPGKLVWSDNSLYSENEDYHDFKLDYTWRAVPYLGFLRIEPSFRYGRWTADNDDDTTGKENWWNIKLTTMPWDDLQLVLEHTWSLKRKLRHPNIGGEILDALEKRRYFIELTKFVPPKRMKFVLSYLYRPEWWVPTGEEWNKNELKFSWEKRFTSRLKFNQEIDYLRIEREKQPHTSSYIHLTSQWLAIKNKLSKEIVKDLTIAGEYEYGSGLDFDGFNYHNFDAEIELFKPGLIRMKIGTGYTYYYEIDDHIWSLYFKLSESAPFAPLFLLSSKWGNNELKLGLGYQEIKSRLKNSDGSIRTSFDTWNYIFVLNQEIGWRRLFLGTELILPIWLNQTNGIKKINDVTTFTYQDFQYNWERVDLYTGWRLSKLFNPYLGIRWSKEKAHYSNTDFLGSSLGTSETETKKSWLLLTGLKGRIDLTKRFALNYGIEYLPSLSTQIFSDLSKKELSPDVEMWQGKLGVEYILYNNLNLYLNANYGRIYWDREMINGVEERMDEEIKYLELILGLKWAF